MLSRINSLIIFTLACGLLLLQGCGSMFPNRVFSVQTGEARPATADNRTIATREFGSPAGQPYTVLGKVMTYRRGGLGAVRELDHYTLPPADMVEALIPPARDMGADAVVGLYHGEYRGVNIGVAYVSGLAVKYLDSSGVTAPADLRVGILPVQTGTAEMDPKDYAVLDRDLRAGARWFLEDKGYFAPVDPAVHFTGSVTDLAADPASTNALYGADTELLLLIELLDEQALVPVLLDFRKVVLKASLYSKSLGKVIWENRETKDNVTGVFWMWMSKAVSRAGAIEKVMQPLPLYTRTGESNEFLAYPPDMVKKHLP